MTENPVMCKYACTRALLCMPVSKSRHIGSKIQKSIALAGLLFAEKRHHAYLCYVENLSIFFRFDP